MECPRCGSELDRYALGGREAVSCGSCGYVGVPVEHRGEPARVESWAEAMERAPDAAQIGSVTVESVAEGDALEVVFDAGSDDDPPEPTVVRIDRPDPALAAALEAVDGEDERFVCDVCGAEFDTEAQLYGHLAAHSGDESGD
jgi:DNA-directed RNA polymerase subunit M/transcription elongation factor TFIIS